MEKKNQDIFIKIGFHDVKQTFTLYQRGNTAMI